MGSVERAVFTTAETRGENPVVGNLWLVLFLLGSWRSVSFREKKGIIEQVDISVDDCWHPLLDSRNCRNQGETLHEMIELTREERCEQTSYTKNFELVTIFSLAKN